MPSTTVPPTAWNASKDNDMLVNEMAEPEERPFSVEPLKPDTTSSSLDGAIGVTPSVVPEKLRAI